MRGKKLKDQSPWLYGKIVFYIVCALILLFLILPIFVVIPLSFTADRYWTFPPSGFSLRWWHEFFSNVKWTSAMVTSLKVAIVATIISTVLGTGASFTLVRGKFRGKNLILSIILLPQIIPFIIVAISLYFFFAELHLIGNWIIVALGHAVLALPIVVVIISTTLKGFDRTVEYAAMNLGANRLRTYLRITFPMIRPGILVSALFAFMTSFDELLIALFLGGERAATIPKRMWEGLRYEINPTIAVVASMLIIFSVAMLFLVEILRRRMRT